MSLVCVVVMCIAVVGVVGFSLSLLLLLLQFFVWFPFSFVFFPKIGLQELINSYFMPLSLSKTIGPAEISQIFVNSARVLEIHKGILKELKAHGGSKRIQLICKFVFISPPPSSPLSLTHFFSSFSRTLGDNVPLKLAYRVFISGFDLATELIEQLDSTNKEFSAALGDCSSQAKKGTWVGKLGLLSLLITPVQRLPRYKLLFSVFFSFFFSFFFFFSFGFRFSYFRGSFFWFLLFLISFFFFFFSNW